MLDLPATDDAAVVLELPGVPVAKGAPRFARVPFGTMAYTPAKTRNFESDLRMAAHDAMQGRPLLVGPLSLFLVASLPLLKSFSEKQRQAAILGLHYPTKKPDLTNYLKAAEDALNCVVFNDDAQVVEQHTFKRYSEHPSLRIEVRPLRSFF
jgi:Holliday junction resolvase RusA-like endonuclease